MIFLVILLEISCLEQHVSSCTTNSSPQFLCFCRLSLGFPCSGADGESGIAAALPTAFEEAALAKWHNSGSLGLARIMGYTWIHHILIGLGFN